MKNVNKVNLYEAQEVFDKLMESFQAEMDVDDGVIADLCLSYVRNMVVNLV